MIKLFIIDGHPLVRAGIRRLLSDERDFEVVGEAGAPDDAIRAIRSTAVDVVLLDLQVGGMGALEAVRRLGRLGDTLRIVAIGHHDSGPLPLRALESGAHGYLSTACDEGEFCRAIRQVYRRIRYISPDVAQKVALNVLDPSGDPMTRLTPRELSVIVMLGQGRARREISKSLCLSPKTVSTYRTRALRKLGARSDVEIAHLCLRHGLLGPAPAASTA